MEWLTQNRDQMIAEAFELYKDGSEDLFIRDQEILAIARIEQESRQEEDPWMESVMHYLLKNERPHSFSLLDLAQDGIGMKPEKIDKYTQIRLGKILKKLNISSKREGHGNIRMYTPPAEIRGKSDPIEQPQKDFENTW